MKTESEPTTLKVKSLQEFISIGYLGLLLLGLMKESITYAYLNINIIKYSSLLDILMSPISILTSDIRIPLFTIIIPSMLYFLMMFRKYIHRKGKDKEWYQKLVNVEKANEKYNVSKEYIAMLSLIGGFVYLFAFILGASTDRGEFIETAFKSGEYEITHEIIFLDKEKVAANIIGQNSQYLFYLSKDQNQVSISPISGNVKKIIKIDK